jgi:hypothetical protein
LSIQRWPEADRGGLFGLDTGPFRFQQFAAKIQKADVARRSTSSGRADCNNLGFWKAENTNFLKFFLSCVKHVVARSNVR